MILSWNAVCLGSKTYYYISEGSVVHVLSSFPYDLAGINAKFVTLLNMVINKCCKKIVC